MWRMHLALVTYRTWARMSAGVCTSVCVCVRVKQYVYGERHGELNGKTGFRLWWSLSGCFSLHDVHDFFVVHFAVIQAHKKRRRDCVCANAQPIQIQKNASFQWIIRRNAFFKPMKHSLDCHWELLLLLSSSLSWLCCFHHFASPSSMVSLVIVVSSDTKSSHS